MWPTLLNERNKNDLDYTFTSDRAPNSFVKIVKCFSPQAKKIEEFWRMTTIAAYRNNREQNREQVLEIAIHSFKQLISKIKTNKVLKPVAYYYRIVNKKLEDIYFEDLFGLGFPSGNEHLYKGIRDYL